MANGTSAADSSSSSPSTLNPPPSETTSSPKTGRKPRVGGGSSPWSSIVRGEPDPAAPQSPPPSASAAVAGTILTGELTVGTADTATLARSDSSDETGINGGNAAGLSSKGEKKSAWNVPQNGAVEGRPVMGAVLWPALSESTKASPKSSSSDLLAVASDGSQSAPPQESVSPNPASKPSGNSINLNNHGPPMKQKSMKRGSKGSNSGSVANGGPAPPSPTTPGEAPQTTSTRASLEPELSPREHNKNGGNWDHATSPRPGGFSPGAHGRNEHHRSYGGGGGGGHRRNNNPGGANHNNFGSRREQDRGSNEWNAHPNFRGRDVQLQQQHQQRAPQRPFLRGPIPGPPPFVNPPSPVRAFVNPLGFPDMHPQMYYIPTPPPPPEVFRPMPYVAPPIFIPHANPQLAFAVLKQIEFYFSPENLCKDVYLRQNMDGEGWVPISLVASFNRVRQLTGDIGFVLESVLPSSVLEVQGERIRRRGDWMNWILRPSAGTTDDSLSTRMRNMDLDGTGGQGNSSNHS